MYKNLYKGKINFKNTSPGSIYKIVEVNFSGRENMTKAYKGRLIEKTKKTGYRNTPGVTFEMLEGPDKGKRVLFAAYKLHFFPEDHSWSYLNKTRKNTNSANRSTRRNRKA